MITAFIPPLRSAQPVGGDIVWVVVDEFEAGRDHPDHGNVEVGACQIDDRNRIDTDIASRARSTVRLVIEEIRLQVRHVGKMPLWKAALPRRGDEAEEGLGRAFRVVAPPEIVS